MNKIEEISRAWVDSFDPTEKQQYLADLRLKICKSCDSLKFNDIINIDYCGECHCPINKKIYSSAPNPCPLGKWNVV